MVVLEFLRRSRQGEKKMGVTKRDEKSQRIRKEHTNGEKRGKDVDTQDSGGRILMLMSGR
jgi:hypothetical protein